MPDRLGWCKGKKIVRKYYLRADPGLKTLFSELLLYMSLDGDDYELSCCELNFTDFDLADFDQENTHPMDRINSKLYQINKSFVAGFRQLAACNSCN